MKNTNKKSLKTLLTVLVASILVSIYAVPAMAAISLFVEAENGIIAGGAQIQSLTGASNGKAVGNLQISGASSKITGINGGTGGTFTLTLRYAVGSSASTKSLFVNGIDVKQLSFASTGSWTTFKDLVTTVTLKSGTANEIMVKNDVGDNANGVNIDKYTVTENQVSKPDYAVTNFFRRTGYTGLNAPGYYTVYLSNNGSVATPALAVGDVTVQINGETLKNRSQIPSLQPGASTTFDIWSDTTVNFKPGTYTAVCKVDVANKVDESNENNNSMSYTFTIQ